MTNNIYYGHCECDGLIEIDITCNPFVLRCKECKACDEEPELISKKTIYKLKHKWRGK